MNDIIREDMERIIAQVDLTPLRGKGVLITGAGGMLASYAARLVHTLNEHYAFGISLGLLVRSRKRVEEKLGDVLGRPEVEVLEQDVCRPLCPAGHYAYILHAAGAADPRSIVERPVEVMEANLLGTHSVCALAKAQGSEILFLSTREVYGALDAVCLREDMAGALNQMNPRSCYPESKRCAEALLLAYFREYGVPFKAVRIAHAYGPGMAIENDGRIMADLMGDIVHGRDLTLKSRGEMKRAFCYISDAVAGMLQVLLYGQPGRAYNLANETEEIAVRDLAEMMARRAGTQVVFALSDTAADRGGYLQIPRVRLDTAAIEALGWHPQVGLREGVERTYRYFTER